MGEFKNTFEKGMNKDFNILYQPNGTYRNCVNCQLISQDGNNYVIKDCLGNVKVFNINIPYNTFVAGAPPTITYQAAPMPIGFISFPDKLIVFSTNNESETGGYGEIGIIQYEPYGEGIQPTANTPANTYSGYVPLYHHISLKFTKQRQIEGFAYAENDIIQRVYWTDDLNEPRVFDVGNPIFTNYIASGSLANGTQYMVVEGAITYNGILYAPDVAAGNIFTANATTVYTDESISIVSAKVIAYFPYQLLNFTPSRSLGNIRFDQYGSGSLYAGTKMYFYRLVNSTDGIQTSWSYGCVPIHVGTTNSIPATPANAYEDFVGAGTTTVLQITSKSVKITVDNIDTNFDNIQIACAEYDQLLDVPRQITIVVDVPITGSTMTLEHTGSSNLGTLTTDDITLFPASIISCKTMATNKNYILIGNITERTELDFDNTGVAITQIEKLMPVHEDNDECSNVLLYDQVGPLVSSNPPLVDGISPYTQWLVVSGGTVTYNATVYSSGQVFEGVPGVFNWAVASGTPVLRPCVYKNKYTTNTAAARPDYIQIKGVGATQGFWNYKDPAVAHHVKGYWNEETYRFGILFYDLKGNPFYVRWLGDYLTAKQESKALINSIPFRAAAPTNMAYISQTGIKISGITISPADMDKISGFSIVRAERDKRIITQGLLMQCASSIAPPTVPAIIRPIAGPESVFCAGFNGGDGNYSYYSLLSPDSLVDFPMDNLTINNYIEECGWLDPKLYQAGVYTKSVTANFQTETKYFNSVADIFLANRKNKVTAIEVINEANVVTNFGGAGYNFENDFMDISGPMLTNTTCISGVPLSTSSLLNSIATGGRKIILRIEGFMFDYNSANDYDDITLAGVRKLLVNYVVDKLTPYGGTSASSLATTNYIQCGHFQPINSTVKSETFNGTNYVFNDVHVWGGDAYTCLIDYGYSLYNSAIIGAAASVRSFSWGMKFPCQCNTNYDLRRGRKIANNEMHAQPTGVAYLEAGTVRLEGFSYNQAYSSQGLQFAYPALPLNPITSGRFPFRIRYAGEKNPGELQNSFRFFPINDYKDTDGQGGEINNIRTKRGQSIVWQNLIISTVPILERVINSSTDGSATTLGTGGVVDRFDPINSYFGNQHQHGLVETEYGFLWFDMRRKAVVVMDISSGIAEVSFIEGMKSYFDEVIIDNLGNVINPRPLNSTTFEETSDRPLVGVGITGVYDPKLKMTYLTFKWKEYAVTVDQGINKGFTIAYYHAGKCFVNLFDVWLPSISWNHNQSVLSVNNPKNKTKYYGAGMSSTAFVVGETVAVGSSEYVCITNVTVASFPGTAGVGGTNPVTGTNNWTLINSTNEIYVHNQPIALGQNPAPDYQYNKWFNLVGNNELEVVINPPTPNGFSVTNIEQHGNNVNYTDIYTEAEGVTAADNSISASNRYYRYIISAICSCLPLSSSSGRITNEYLKIRFFKKNWTTNPTVLTGLVKKLQYIKSFFEQKR